MAADGSKADSYVGSLISLTSKSEIRYEGILYSINTEESSIGLRNVRSFGTEGRKKDGPQVPPSDKVYEYILFRGSDIKDLQVKSSPPVQATSSIDNDPAIIQSHYPCPAATSTSLPTVVTLSSSDANSQTPQLGQPGSNFQGGIPLYQPGGNLGSWGPSPPPPNANATGLAVPMYWPGFYGPPSGLPQMHQQSMLRPPPGLPMPHIQQPMQYPGFNPSLPTGALNLPASNLPELPSSLLNSTSRSSTATSSSLTGTSLPPALSNTMASETLTSSLLNKSPSSVLSMITPNASLPLSSPLNISGMDVNVSAPPASSKASSDSLTSSLADSSTAGQSEAPTPTLVTPDQLLQSGKAPISLPQSSEIAHKDVEVVQVASASNSSVPVTKDAQPPILPLPPASRALHKPNGGHYQGYQSYRGRGRGRGTGGSRRVTSFTEEFDFMAMNEKFKKEEVWDHLGKSNRSDKKDKGGNGNVSDEDNSVYEDAEFPQAEVKPVYNKDDFFDTLSCNADQDSQNGRTRFSEQMKIDTETFGDFPRYRSGRGGRGYRGGRGRAPNHGRAYGYNSGGGRGYGSYNGSGGRGYDYNGSGSGRGYDYNGGSGGRGYGYNGRGRGRGLSSQAS